MRTIMPTMNQVARWAALGPLAFFLACSSPSRPSAQVLRAPNDRSLHDSGSDSSPIDATAKDVVDAAATTLGDAGVFPTVGEASAEGEADPGTEAVMPAWDGDQPPCYVCGPWGPPGPSEDSGDGFQTPPSCTTSGLGISDCANDAGSCCASLNVSAGSFFRSYDGVSSGFTSQSAPAGVSSLRLDQYEVTVGRFRQFVAAEVIGWLPPPGSGKHTYLNEGNGLVDSSSPNSFESGWDSSWTASLATTVVDWNANLSCDPTSATWTSAAAGNESKPIGCVTWYEAYAFCIWDGAFLPSEAEWNYAATGGGDQRVYPWSSPPTSSTIDCSYANYLASDEAGSYDCASSEGGAATRVGSESPKGDGKWGQADLAGNVMEWTLDYFANYVASCPNCAYLTSTSARVVRGGSYEQAAAGLLASARSAFDPTTRFPYLGVRCGRTP